MKLVLNYYKPITCKWQHFICTLNKKETKEFTTLYGPPKKIIREYRKSIPNPYKITGMGWIKRNNDGCAKEEVYIIQTTFREELI